MKLHCPNVNRPEYKKLVTLLGGGEKGTLAAQKLINKFSTTEDPEAEALKVFDTQVNSVPKKLEKLRNYSSKIRFEKEGHKYFFGDQELVSTSAVLNEFPETTYHADKEGEPYQEVGTAIHKAFELYIEGRGEVETEKNVRAALKKEGLPEDLFIQIKKVIDPLKATGTVVAEFVVGDVNKGIAGQVDILHFKDDGTVDVYDIKTAHYTPDKIKRQAKIWDPGDFDGYKGRRYSTQVAFYSEMVERILDQPITNSYIIPIEVEYNDSSNISSGIKSTKIIGTENVYDYGHDRTNKRLVDKFFGDTNPTRPVLNSIDDIGDFMREVTGVSWVNTQNSKSLDDEAENILKKHSKKINGSSRYWNGKKWIALKSEDRAAQKRQIIDEYLKRNTSITVDKLSSIENWLETGGELFRDEEENRTTSDQIKNVLAKYKDNRNVVRYRLSEIPGFNVSNRENWFVFQEGDNMDIIYFGDESDINAKLNKQGKKDLFHRIFNEKLTGRISSKYHLGSDLQSTLLDAKKLEASLIAMKLKESNPNLKFDRILIHSILDKSKQRPVEVDLSETIPVIGKIAKHGKFQGIIPSQMKTMFTKQELLDYKNYGMDILKLYRDFVSDFVHKNSRPGADVLDQMVEDYIKEGANQEELIRLIEEKSSKLREKLGDRAETSRELYLLSKMAYELKQVNTKVSPIREIYEKFFAMPQHIANEIIHDLVEQVSKKFTVFKNEYWNNYKKPFDKYREALFKDQQGLGTLLQDYTLGDTTKYYETLFSKKTVKVDDGTGNTREVIVTDYALITEGTPAFNSLTKAQQQYITAFNDKVQDAATMLGIEWERGKIPLLRSSFVNQFYKVGKDGSTTYKQLFDKFLQSMEDNFEYVDTESSDQDSFRTRMNRFRNQMDKRESLLGLDKDGNITDLEDYNAFETNLEVVLDMFTINAMQNKHMGELWSSFDTALNILEYQKANLFEDRLQQNIDWIKVYRDRILLNKDVDPNGVIHKTVRTANKFTSFSLLGFKLKTGVVAAIGQQLSAFSKSLANSFSANEYFGAGDWLKAGTLMTSPKNYEKVELLLEEYGLFDLDYMAITSGLRRQGNRSLFQQKNAYWLLNRGDKWSRGQMLFAQMLKDGVWDAYSVTDGNLVYDETKDKRFQEEDGKLIKEYLKSQAAKEGWLSGSETDPLESRKLTRAYDLNLTIKHKALHDSVIGGFDAETKALYNSYWQGKLFGLFLTWMPARIGKTISSDMTSRIEGNVEIITDSEGKKQVVWKGKDREGYFATLKHILYNLRHTYDKDMRTPLTPKEKENLMNMGSDLSLISFSLLLASALAHAAEDDDESRRLTQEAHNILIKGLQDITAAYNLLGLADVVSSPISVAYLMRSAHNMFNVIAGIPDQDRNTLNELFKDKPVVREIIYINSLLEDNK